MRLSLEERVEAFHRSFPNASKLIIHNNVIYGVWIGVMWFYVL